jgi:hypothetical protein
MLCWGGGPCLLIMMGPGDMLRRGMLSMFRNGLLLGRDMDMKGRGTSGMRMVGLGGSDLIRGLGGSDLMTVGPEGSVLSLCGSPITTEGREGSGILNVGLGGSGLKSGLTEGPTVLGGGLVT